MGRAYAGILGPLAFALVSARGVLAGGGMEQALLAACAALFVFAGIGYLAGQTADYLVRESVRTQFQTAMAAWEQKKTQPQPTT
jgi:poly(3-hydroxybutyrate) depolymerase